MVTVVAPALPAQITTAVVPPRPAQPEVDPVAERVRRAERLEERITEMREWVDSVAIEIEARPTVRDTVGADAAPPAQQWPAAEPAPRRTPPPPRAPPRVEAFREGAPAPATATSLPLMAFVGTALTGLGALLRRWR